MAEANRKADECGESRTAWAGRFLEVRLEGRWEFVRRRPNRPGVGIVAITDAGKLVLVEQYRVPAGRRVVELPAGLVGDLAGQEQESARAAAERELLEETGYAARHWQELAHGYASPGLTDESVMLFLARGLQKLNAGGGDGSESIQVHEIFVEDVLSWLRRQGLAADLKLLAGLYLAQAYGAEA